jgi:hypothetical protein
VRLQGSAAELRHDPELQALDLEEQGCAQAAPPSSNRLASQPIRSKGRVAEAC